MRYLPNAASQMYVEELEKTCPNLRMTAEERKQLHLIFSKCQKGAWESIQKIIEDHSPK
jgi:hypothetical protein